MYKRQIIGSGAVLYAGCPIGSRALIADLAAVREQVSIGERTIIGRGAAIENCCAIGSYSKLETNVYLCAYSQIGDRCFVAVSYTHLDVYKRQTLSQHVSSKIMYQKAVQA